MAEQYDYPQANNANAESAQQYEEGYYDENGQWVYYEYEAEDPNAVYDEHGNASNYWDGSNENYSHKQPYQYQQSQQHQPQQHQQHHQQHQHQQHHQQQPQQHHHQQQPQQHHHQQPQQHHHQQEPQQHHHHQQEPQQHHQQHQPQQQQEKKNLSRIDPRQIPRPQTVNTEAPAFYYTASQTNPPPTSAECVVVDDGNCSPRFIRLTSYQVPVSNELVETTRLSIGAVFQPLAQPSQGEESVPTVDMGENGVIRCSRCHAYINPFFSFAEDGQHFTCNLCRMQSPLPHWYHCNVDADGNRRDRNDRPELHLGSVEFIAPAAYSTREQPQQPCFIFVLDTSFIALSSGLLETSIKSLRSCIHMMVEYPTIRVGVITYSDVVHVYSFKASSRTASMMIVADVNNVFVPVPSDEILVFPSDPHSLEALNKLLDQLMQLHQQLPRVKPAAFGAALHVAAEALNIFGGKILIVQSALCRKGMGSLDSREESSLYGTKDERQLYLPQDSFYQVEATACAERCISIDMFLCANEYSDIATISVLSSMTGGQMFYYPNFHVRKDAFALECDMMHTLTRETGFDGVLTVRTSAGLKVSEYMGSFFRRRPGEIELPIIDCDKAFAVRIEHEETLQDKSMVCLQCAMLYTNFEGERRIRVHTIQVPTTSSMSNVFRHSDLEAVVNLSMKQASTHALEAGLTSARTSLRQALIDVLYVYRKRCATATSIGQLILPESLKLLPIYTLGIIKSALLSDGFNADDRAFFFNTCKSMAVNFSTTFCLPHFYALHNMEADVCIPDESGSIHMPMLQMASSEFLDDDGVYLLDNGRVIFLYVANNVSLEIVEQIFGVPDFFEQDPAEIQVYPTDDPYALATRVSALIEFLRAGRPQYVCVRVVHSGTKDIKQFTSLLFESPTTPISGSDADAKSPDFMSYVDFLCYIHRQISDRIGA